MKTILALLCFAVACAAQVPPALVSSKKAAAAGGGGGEPEWIDVLTFAASDSSSQSQQDATYAQQITLGAGQATKFRIYSHDTFFNFAGVVKFALYDSGGNVVGTTSDYGSVSITAGAQYFEITFATPPTLTAGTYWLAWNAENGGQTFRYKNGAGSVTINSQAHSGFPTATISTASPSAQQYVVSIFAVAP